MEFSRIYRSHLEGLFRKLHIHHITKKIVLKIIGNNKNYRILDKEIKFQINSFGDYKALKNQMREKSVLNDIAAEASKGDTFIDVGANRGFYSIPLAMEDLSVIAFEPNKKFKKLLKRNCRLNNVDIEIRGEALYNQNTTLKVDGMNVRPDEGGEIEGKKGRKALRGEKPDILKVDTEGTEKEVVDGFEEQIRNFKVLYIELHPNKSNPKKIIDYIEKKNFDVRKINKRDHQDYIKCVNQKST